MKTKVDLNLIRPELKECSLISGDTKIILESPDGQGQLVLPKEHEKIIDLFDGKRSVQDITSELYNQYGTVSFNSIITTVHLLKNAGLLEELEVDLDDIKTDKSPHDQKPSILIRPLFEKVLVSKLNLPKTKSNLLFFLVLGLVWLGVLVSPWDGVWKFDFSQFLKVDGHYEWAVVRLVGIASFLLTFKTILKSILLFFCVGKAYNLSIRLNPYALSLNIGENSVYAQDKKYLLLSYGVTTAVLHIFTASLLALAFPDSPFINDIKILAVLLTFIELDPYKSSELTKIFNFLYAEDQLKSMTPYLKNCSISTVIDDKGTKLADEIRFYIYSLLAITWAVVFTLFAIDLLSVNLPALLLELQGSDDIVTASGEMIEGGFNPIAMASSIYVLAILGIMFVYLFYDLGHTLYNNVFSFMFAPLSGLIKRGSSYKEDDLTSDVLVEELKLSSFFNNMSDDVLEFVVEHSELKSMKKGTHLMVQDTEADSFFFLLKGHVELNYKDNTGRVKTLVNLPPHSVVGEMAIVADSRRTANAVASEDIVYLEIAVEDFRELMEDEELKTELRNIKSRVEISQFVSTAGLFKDFPPEVMNVFVESGDLVNFPQGEEIVTQGEEDKTFYLLIKGNVDILVDNEVVANLGQGDFFGEIALIADSPRTATVKCNEDCLFLYIENKNFWKILSENIDLAMYIESIGRHRMENAS